MQFLKVNLFVKTILFRTVDEQTEFEHLVECMLQSIPHGLTQSA